MHKEINTADNFFDDAPGIRQIALEQNWYSNTGTSYFRGMRADVPDSIYDDISRQILEYCGLSSGKIYLWFAYQTGDVQLDENCIHTVLSHQGKMITTLVKSFNFRLRHFLSRLQHLSLCYSKSK